MYATRRASFATALVGVFAVAAAAQDCCQPSYQPVTSYHPVTTTVYEYRPVTTYRLEYETVFEEKEITVQKPVWETEYRERRYRVAKPVIETTEREERYTVLRPVWETEYRECSYDRVRYVTETEMREQRYVVSRPVCETSYREQRRVVCRPVTETVMQDYTYTTYRPVTTMRTEYVDQGAFVSQWVYKPGNVRNRLRWLPGGYAVDPLTGTTYWRRAGLYWVPSQAPGAYALQQQYVPNVVAVQKPQTTYVPETVTEKRPVQVTRYQQEVVVEKVPVRVCRTEQVEEVRQVPVTVRKPVVERVSYKVPVKTCRWVRQEMVRKVPVTVQRYEYEERVERVPVRVCRMVTEVRKVLEPRTIVTWKPYQTLACAPRTVLMQVPADACTSLDLPGTSSSYVPATPATPPSSTGETTVQKVPSDAEPSEKGKSVMKKADGAGGETEPAAQKPQASSEDMEPTGTPQLDGSAAPANPPAPPADTQAPSQPAESGKAA